MAKKLESKLQRDIRRALEREVGGFWFKVHGGPFQQAGIPDLLGCVQGLYIGMEVKRPDDKRGASDIQRVIIGQIKREGGYACVVKSPEEAVRRLKRWLRKNGKDPQPQVKILSEESGETRKRRRKRRLVHGAGDWQNDHRPKGRGRSTLRRLR